MGSPPFRMLRAWPAILVLAGSAAHAPEGSPFPTRMQELAWHASLASARAAAKQGSPVVLYCVPTVALRDRVDWLEKQRRLFENATMRALLAGVPLLAVGPGRQAPKELAEAALPQLGFAVLDAKAAKVLASVPISGRRVPRILAELARALGRAPPALPGAGPDDRARFTAKRRELRALLDADDAAKAQALCAAELARAPRSFYARVLDAERRAALRTFPDSAARERLSLCVVVRDRAAFLRALAAWGKGPIFPILYADARFLPRFVAAYRPAEVRFLGETARRLMRAPGRKRLLAALAKARARPAPATGGGLVVTHESAAQCEAGLALAAAYGQRLAFEAPVAKPMRLADRPALERLRAKVARVAPCALTLALDLPYRYRDSLYADRRPLAFDDAILRDEYDLPAGAVGRLVGDSQRTLYQAMCALFLRPERALLFSRYATTKQPWKSYDTPPAAKLLEGRIGVTQVRHPDATLARWRELFAEPSPFGLVHVNSSGGAKNWSTSKGGGKHTDIPMTVPAIVSFTHSGSAANAYSDDTIAGRWLANGAYFYFGSCSEPYLDAFVPIHRVWERALAGEPLGLAFRQRIGVQRWRPWKLVCLGDPLLRLAFGRYATVKPKKPPLPRLVPLKSAARRNPFRLAKTELAGFRALVKRLADAR